MGSDVCKYTFGSVYFVYLDISLENFYLTRITPRDKVRKMTSVTCETPLGRKKQTKEHPHVLEKEGNSFRMH